MSSAGTVVSTSGQATVPVWYECCCCREEPECPGIGTIAGNPRQRQRIFCGRTLEHRSRWCEEEAWYPGFDEERHKTVYLDDTCDATTAPVVEICRHLSDIAASRKRTPPLPARAVDDLALFMGGVRQRRAGGREEARVGTKSSTSSLGKRRSKDGTMSLLLADAAASVPFMPKGLHLRCSPMEWTRWQPRQRLRRGHPPSPGKWLFTPRRVSGAAFSGGSFAGGGTPGGARSCSCGASSRQCLKRLRQDDLSRRRGHCGSSLAGEAFRGRNSSPRGVRRASFLEGSAFALRGRARLRSASDGRRVAAFRGRAKSRRRLCLFL